MEDKKFSLNTTYEWFEETVGKGVDSAISTFWENDFKVFLTSINDFENIKDDPILKGELFYTCQISIKNKQHITLRVSSDFIRIIFHDTFNSNSPLFNLEQLTELERKILNEFFEFIVKNLDNTIIKETETSKIDPLNKTELNFVFLIKTKKANAGKLSLKIPLNRLKVKPLAKIQNFEFEDFLNNFAYVDIIAGYTKLSVDDLKNLEKDDILLLEKSDIRKMTLKTETVECEFKVNPEPSIMIDMDIDEEDENEGFEYKENINMPNDKTMWDDIQIEVAAEFKKVKMTLGELKQISKGLVIDLGAVMNNEISLLVENKAVAKGELVIINDKYGVKITDVFASKKPETKEDVKPIAKEGVQAPPPAAANARPLPPNGMPRPIPPNGPNGAPPPRPIPARPQAARPAQGAAPNAAPPQRPIPPRPQAAMPNGAKPAPRPQAKPQAGAQDKNFDYSNFEE